MSIEDVENIEIKIPEVPAGLWGDQARFRTQDAQEGASEAFVAPATLLAFAEGVSHKEQEDINYSMLFARFAADNKYSMDDNVVEWTKEYFRVLGFCGWVVRSYAPVEKIIAEDEADVHKSVIAMISAGITGPALGVLTLALESLESMAEDDGFIKLFQFFSENEDRSSFQLGAVQKEASGALTVGLAAYRFVLKARNRKVLFFKRKKRELQLWARAANASFSQEAYDAVRDTVREKLDAANLQDLLAPMAVRRQD
jgi:hypothetical protein